MIATTKGLVYLAGPITGLTFGQCTDWRDYAASNLIEDGIKPLSPMRGKEYLARIAATKPLAGDCDKYSVISPLSSNRGITTRDRWDATRCDVLLVNVTGAKAVSIGTVMEIAWADLSRIPIVMAAEDDNIHWGHGMIKEAVGFRTETLDAALEIVKAILL